MNVHPKSRQGSLLCCHQCPSTHADASPLGYFLQYNVTYRQLRPHDPVQRSDLIGFDVTGGSFEYQVPEALGSGSIHTKVRGASSCL